MLHLFGTCEDTKKWAKVISYPSTIAANNPKTPKKPIILPISETHLQKGVTKTKKLR